MHADRFVMVRHPEGGAELIPWTRIVKIMAKGEGHAHLFAVLRRERVDHSQLIEEDGTCIVDVIDADVIDLWRRRTEANRYAGR
jgi:hypothetical protein